MDNFAVPEELQEVYLAAKELIRLCGKHHVLLTGFLFSYEPTMFMHITTVTERGPDLTALHLRLCDHMDSGSPILFEKLKREGD